MNKNNIFAQLPSVSRLLEDTSIQALVHEHGQATVVNQIRGLLDEIRQSLTNAADQPPSEADLLHSIKTRVMTHTSPRLRAVFNLTGTVLHTNLGRAPLADEAVEALVLAARNPCALEYDLKTGKRGDRDDLVESLVCELTGAEAATVVNNNAAAVFLLLNTLAREKKVLVSRGELVEIGGAFRIPDVMTSAGALLKEVGTTNRTHLRDFEGALDDETAMLMKVHTSNYSIQGFTHAVPEAELARLAHEHGLPFVIDLGSGTLVNLEDWGLPHEPTAQEGLAAGADLVTFSGDKLLGGPQAGLIVGRKDLIERIKRNPLKRALRVSKITLAALEATLRLYRNPERLAERLLALGQLARSQSDIQAAAERLLPPLQKALHSQEVDVSIASLRSQIGSGSLPVERLDSAGIAVSPRGKKAGILHSIEAAFRALPRSVIGRIEADRLLLDLRCLPQEQEAEFIAQLEQLEVNTRC